jgi:hypothetical protein
VLLHAVESKRDEPRLPPLTGPGNYAYNRIREDILMNGMHTMARYLAGFPGRKNLIWCTGHLPRTLYGDGFGNPFPDTPTFIDDLNQTTDELRLSRVAVYPIDSRGLETDPAFDASNARRSSLRATPGPHNFIQNVELEEVAEATGGKAYYNTNGLKQAIAQIIDNGSNYYTISYTPSDPNWNGGYRKIKVEVAASGVHLQYRRGYYARNRERLEQRHVAKAGRRQITGQFDPANETKAGQSATVLRGPQESLAASMTLGAVPPTELIFDVSVSPGTAVQKLEKNDPRPKDNYLRAEFAKKPYRNYRVILATPGRTIQFGQSADGLHHGQVECVLVVYSDKGDVVNSLITTSLLDLDPLNYKKVLNGFITTAQEIAVPVKGNYFLRVGVHDVAGNKVGATEIPVDEIKLGVAGPGQTLQP